nr:hypothetical protein [Candidatus Sigynarchaeota archaeon]
MQREKSRPAGNHKCPGGQLQIMAVENAALARDAATVGVAGRITLIIFSLFLTILSLCISYVALKHAYPMSVYPAFVAFTIIHYFTRKRLPSPIIVAIFLIAYELFIVLAVLGMASYNHVAIVDFSRLLEPVYYGILVITPFILRNTIDGRRYIPLMYLACGIVMVVLAFVSMIPGNPIVDILQNPAGGQFVMIDGFVPGTIMTNIYIFYHVLFLMGPFGCVAIMFGVVILVFGVKMSDQVFFSLIISIVLSIYVVGLPFTWIIFQNRDDTKRRPALSRDLA